MGGVRGGGMGGDRQAHAQTQKQGWPRVDGAHKGLGMGALGGGCRVLSMRQGTAGRPHVGQRRRGGKQAAWRGGADPM